MSHGKGRKPSRGKPKKDTETDSDNDEYDNNNNTYQNMYDATNEQVEADGENIDIDEPEDDDWEDDGDDLDDIGGDDDGVNDDDDVECAYNVTRSSRGVKKVIAGIDRDDDDDDDIDDLNVDENILNPDIYVAPEDRRSNRNLTKYEVVRLLGERTTQLSHGAKPMIEGVENLPARTIAQLELESNMIPIKIIRPLPNGKKELWTLDELRLKQDYVIYEFYGGNVDREHVISTDAELKKGGSIMGYNRHVLNKMSVKKKSKSKSTSKKKTKSSGSKASGKKQRVVRKKN